MIKSIQENKGYLEQNNKRIFTLRSMLMLILTTVCIPLKGKKNHHFELMFEVDCQKTMKTKTLRVKLLGIAPRISFLQENS